jgi:hypothetical protein
MTTVVFPAALVHPLTVAVTLYVPAFTNAIFEMEGFCSADVNPLGPVHEYVAPAIVLAVRFNVDPTHNGPLLPVTGVEGIVPGPTVFVCITDGQLDASVTVTE